MPDLSILGATYLDVLKYLRNVDLSDCAEAGTDEAGQAEIERQMKAAWSDIKRRIPSKYREMLTACPGELFARLTSGAQTFTLTMDDATEASVFPYHNLRRPWSTRSPADRLNADQYEVTGQTLAIGSGIVGDGDWIVAEYEHNGSVLYPTEDEDDYTLQEQMVKLAAFKVAWTLFIQVEGGEVPEMYLAYRDDIATWIEGLHDGIEGIPVLDNVDLYEDWSAPKSGLGVVKVTRG